MQYDEIMQATMLLCCYFNKNEVKNFKPLSGLEYSKLAQWLYQNKWSPADLLTKTDEILTEWSDSKGKITAERIKQLLSRGVSMSFALEKWTKQGIWVISRVSEFYPKAIKKHLGEQRPPILFGLGNQQLLNQAGLGFVGSRSISEDDGFFASDKAIQAVDEGYTVISGGAKGVDQVAMQAALDHGGRSVGILADGIYTNEARRIFLDYLRQGTLVLISPFFPEAGFSVGSAMARNKFIYTMSEAVIVVKSDKDKGGTWTGAKENLNKKWVPLLVRDIQEEGNQALIQMGGISVGLQKVPYAELLSAQPVYKELNAMAIIDIPMQQPDLLASNLDMFETLDETPNSFLENQVDLIAKDKLKENALSTSSEIDINSLQVELIPEFGEQADGYNDESREVQIQQKYGAIFELFVNTLISLSADNTSSFSLDDIKKQFPELQDTQIKRWLKELELEGFLLKEGRKARYKTL
ncbi:DNA-processing protein DprA [Acinetobacter haemolyticus]|uniref:DNA-processing protein DprA n=1 Tax=Acinetobacter haemolyticus TaxID=29430 RepID=UPI0013724DC9|nr:DNA-processing protein DprA [Acinetobacter haemolyticus]NAR99504.1 DNA-processing protein DprA [Acinetobacter haemolyticus]